MVVGKDMIKHEHALLAIVKALAESRSVDNDLPQCMILDRNLISGANWQRNIPSTNVYIKFRRDIVVCLFFLQSTWRINKSWGNFAEIGKNRPTIALELHLKSINVFCHY